MPRAHRYYVPGHVWHITHRCHQKDFFLKFAKDRNRWLHWLFEAKKRFGLVVSRDGWTLEVSVNVDEGCKLKTWWPEPIAIFGFMTFWTRE
jgi:hypothetical protein